MTSPRAKTCAACGNDILASAVYYRFTLVLQGEQDVLDAPASAGLGTEEELAALLRQLEAAPEDAQELEEQVHWERSGVVCAACRSVVARVLAVPAGTDGPH